MDEKEMSERLINLTLEIIYLLTGENFPPIKSAEPLTITLPPRHFLMLESKNKQKILEVTKKITELLTGEVPIRCQDVTVYFSMEEWEYLEEHKELYKDVVMESQPTFTSPDGSSNGNPPEGCPSPLYSHRDNTEENLIVPHHYQSEDLSNPKIEVKTEGKPNMKGIQRSLEEVKMMVTIKEEPSSLDIGSDGRHNWDTSVDLPFSADDCAVNDGIIQCSALSVHRRLCCTNVLSDSSPSEDPYYKCCPGTTDPFPGVGNVDRPACLEFHFDELPPNIFPRMHLAQNASDPFNPVGSSQDSFDTVVVKVEEMFPDSMDGKSPTSLDRHPFSCSECGKGFNTKSLLTRHKKVHPYPWSECRLRDHCCPECGKNFLHKGDLVRHLRHHTGERPFECSECGLYFKQRCHLTRHFKVHTGEKPFLCAECGKCFTRKDTYINHQQIHMDKEKYVCKECGKGFALHGLLILHQQSHGEQPAKPKHRRYFTTTAAQVHQSADATEIFSCLDSERFYPGSNCAKEPLKHGTSPSQKQSPATYVSARNREKPFSCSECGKFYSHKKHLIRHQRIHTGKLPYKCLECGRCFNEKRYLINHQRNHVGERPFSCSECGKTFTWKESLIRHEKFHSGVRPHSCPECGKCFTQRGDLLRHRRTHMDKSLF